MSCVSRTTPPKGGSSSNGILGIGLVLMLLLIAPAATWAANADELVIKNSVMSRTLTWFAGPLRTTRLEANGVQMIANPGVEFLIDLDHKGEPVTLLPSDFETKGIDTIKVDQETQIVLKLQSLKQGLPLRVLLRYHYLPSAPYLQKSITVSPSKDLTDSVLRRVTLEYCSFRPEFVPVSPVDRFAGNSRNRPKADLSDTSQRFQYGRRSDFAVIDQKANKGAFFFLTSLTGTESYTPGRGLVMMEDTYTPLGQGYETGRATIGAVAGPPEVLFKRFREFLWENHCVMRGKPVLVEYDTRLVERQDVSEQKSLELIKVMAGEGYFNALHLGYGWENHYPLTDDSQKFPQGIPHLASQAVAMGLRMAYWVNPLGSWGQTADAPERGGAWDGLVNDHPEWFATYDKASNPTPKGKDILSFTTPYADYVRERLLRLVTEGNAAMLYIDGSDWNVFPTPSAGPYHVPRGALPFAVLDRYKSIYADLRKANKDLIICLSPQMGNQPGYAHRLGTLDQIEFWDGTDQGCLGDRQQRYNQAFIFPPCTINSGWYGEGLELPFPRVRYAIISGISSYPQIQGIRQISDPSPELSAYLKRFFAFRKKFEPYFTAYQHVLGFPDGKEVDGEGHIIANKGFILLFNPSDQAKKVALPLNEAGLELKGELTLTDWTELDSGTSIGKAKPGDRFELEIGPVSAKIIGINVGP